MSSVREGSQVMKIFRERERLGSEEAAKRTVRREVSNQSMWATRSVSPMFVECRDAGEGETHSARE